MSEPVFSNAEEAAQALAASVQADAEGRVAPEPSVTPDPAENQPSVPDATGSPDEQPESFTDYQAAIDALPDESKAIVEARLAQMQGDYTRKTQEVAEQRREAEQAIQFVHELETNPNFALQVYNEIADALEQSGWSPQEASNEARRQVEEAVDTGNQPIESEIDPNDPIVQELNELKSWRAEMEEAQLYQEMENEFDRMDVAVRQSNPDFSEEDMSHVYALSYATGGDLLAAADAYKAETERIVSSYLEQKAKVSSGTPANLSPTGPAQQPPEGFDGLYDPRLNAAAERMLGESLG
jgi:hypothetical protein